MNPIDIVLSRLDKVRKSEPGQWSARCPAHEDRHPSLSVGAGEDGRVLLKCHAGCTVESICAAIGIAVRDLFPDSAPPTLLPPKPAPKPQPPRPLGDSRRSFATAEDAVRSATSSVQRERGSEWNLTKRYPYHDADGQEVLCVLRFEPPEPGAKTFRPIHTSNGQWFIGDPDGLLPLYRLPTLAAVDTIYVVEGEKAADAAVEIGLVATTNAHGARSAKRTDWSPLAGKSVVLLPDNDGAGRAWAVEVSEILAELGATVRVATLPDLPEHGDVVEFIAARRAAGLDDAAIRAEVEVVAKAAEPVGGDEDDDGEREEPDTFEGFEEPRKFVEFRDGVPWMPDVELLGESRRFPFDPRTKPFSSLVQLAEQVARGLRGPRYEARWLRLHTCSIQIMAHANLSERAKVMVRVWYVAVRDQVPATDHHLTYTVAADRLSKAHGEDLLWSAVRGGRIYGWNLVFWDHDLRALAERWSDENAQTFLAEMEKLDRIADRLDNDGDKSPELLANLEKRFPVEKWNAPPDPESKAAAQKAKIEALGRLQALGLGEDDSHLCWRVNVAAFLRWRAREVERLYRKLETPAGVEAVLEKVRYQRQRPEEDFDREPYLFVAKNCVIDLRTGQVVAPDRSKLLTKQAGAEYRPGYTCEKWTAALDEWTGADKLLQRWLQVMVGYSLIGLRSGGRYIIVIFGKTRTAKGTFLKIIARALGMYASPFNARAFSDTRHSSHDEDLASLRGVRFAYASEMASARFDAEKLKAASSGDPMRVSRKGEQSFSLAPEASIWMATNDVPGFPTHDGALMDRLRFVEFDQQFALSARGDELAGDPDVLAAVLAWAVEGAIEFLQNGLPECPKVAKAIEKARGELDPLAEWYEERVDPERVNDTGTFTSAASLYIDYLVHAAAHGERAVSGVEFGRLLSQRSVQSVKRDNVRGWRLQLRTPPRSRL